jgi:hypothetical protein
MLDKGAALATEGVAAVAAARMTARTLVLAWIFMTHLLGCGATESSARTKG